MVTTIDAPPRSIRGERPPARRRIARALVAVHLAVAHLGGTPASSSAAPHLAYETMTIPPEEQVPIFLKALGYDRNLQEKARGDILVGLLYMAGSVESESAARTVAKLIAAYPEKQIADLPIYYRMIPYHDRDELATVITDEWVDVLYLAPGTADLLDSVLVVTGSAKVLTVTGVAGYVDRGVTLGIGEKDGRAEIVVNLASATREGTRFTGQFLNLCRVIRPPAVADSLER